MSNDFDLAWEHGHVDGKGRKARIICVNRKSAQPVVALVSRADDSEEPQCFSLNGQFYSNAKSEYDLINAPAPKRKFVRWVNMYEGDGQVHPSRETSDHRASEDRIACVRVEFEEGDGL